MKTRRRHPARTGHRRRNDGHKALVEPSGREWKRKSEQMMTTLKLPFTRSDLVMIREAVRHGWNVPPATRAVIVRELQRAADDPGNSESLSRAIEQTLQAALKAGWNSAVEINGSTATDGGMKTISQVRRPCQDRNQPKPSSSPSCAPLGSFGT